MGQSQLAQQACFAVAQPRRVRGRVVVATEKNGGRNVSRSALWLADAGQKPRIYFRGRAHVGFRDRGQHRDLQRDRSSDAAPAAVSEFRTPLRAVEERACEEY